MTTCSDQEKKHAHCRYMDCLVVALSGRHDITVHKYKSGVYDLDQLHDGSYAVNVIFQGDSPGAKTSSRIDGKMVAVYKSVMDVLIEVYAQACNADYCDVHNAAGWVQSKMRACSMGVSSVDYAGSSYFQGDDGDNDFSLIKLRYKITYYFAPSMPWLTNYELRNSNANKTV